jgi:Ca-activated chloride channel family protein
VEAIMSARVAVLVVTYFALLTLLARGAAGQSQLSFGPPMRLRDAGQGSLMLRTQHDGVFLPAPVLETRVQIRVTGLIARATVTQRFHNPTQEWLEGVYVFPLSDKAAVDGLRMIVGERIIEGRIQEREEAKRVYQEARRQGRKASLVEQERPNIFTTSVANIGPDEDVEIVIQYQEDLRYQGGRFELRFPMVVGPRYIPASSASEGSDGSGLAGNTGAVPAAERLTPPVSHPDTWPINPVRIEVALETGVPLTAVTSPSHAIRVERTGASHYRVALAGGTVAADRDFVLEWQPEATGRPRAALFGEALDGDHYALLMLMPPHGSRQQDARMSRETIFVIDTSGSMHGTSIEQAQSALALALERLRPEDWFNVIQFNSASETLFPRSVRADGERVREAQRYVRGLAAEGGTEMLPALREALGGANAGGAVRQVIFITDGNVGNEVQLFSYVSQHLGESRLFTVGIGSAPNSHFMRKAAQFGRGTFTHIGNPREVAVKMGELLGKLESPVLTDVRIAWSDPGIESWPERIPDLYQGEPVVIVARLRDPGADLVLSGRKNRERWELRVGLDDAAPGSGIDKLWARKRIAALMDSLSEGADVDRVRGEVIELGIRHRLVSKFTSLVAVDVTPSAPAGVTPATRPLAINLPAGWSYEAVFGALPGTATPAPLWRLLGWIALSSAALLRLVSARRAT